MGKKASLMEHFSSLKDPRIDRTKRHLLMDIIVIAICAVICGADGWEDIEEYGKTKKPWLKQFLKLPNGIPSHDTFARVFSRIDAKQFQPCFINWIQAVRRVTNGELIAINGKTLRRSYDRRGDKAALHLISAWAAANHLVLGQRKVDDASNEITAIPALLAMLELRGCLVTIDAIGCQKEIARQIRDKEADYLLAVKKNQGTLYDEI